MRFITYRMSKLIQCEGGLETIATQWMNALSHGSINFNCFSLWIFTILIFQTFQSAPLSFGLFFLHEDDALCLLVVPLLKWFCHIPEHSFIACPYMHILIFLACFLYIYIYIYNTFILLIKKQNTCPLTTLDYILSYMPTNN